MNLARIVAGQHLISVRDFASLANSSTPMGSFKCALALTVDLGRSRKGGSFGAAFGGSLVDLVLAIHMPKVSIHLSCRMNPLCGPIMSRSAAHGFIQKPKPRVLTQRLVHVVIDM
jgi:hypothetical protein